MRPTEPAAPPSRHRPLSRRTAWTAAVVATATLAACGDNTGVDIQSYNVSLVGQPEALKRDDGAAVITINLVVDTDVGHVIGASLRYAVSAGDLSDTTATSGANGLATVVWTVTPAQAGGQTDLVFSACADNQDPAGCTPIQMATLHPGDGS
jgi:hypothetical protein